MGLISPSLDALTRPRRRHEHDESPHRQREQIASVKKVDMKLEIVVIPVSDVDRAKEFYGRLGWRLDADFAAGDDFRVIQFTPPGSGCSVIFGKNVTAAAPGSAQGLYLIVSDIEAARDELLGRGVEISEVFHDAGGVYAGADEPYLFGRLRVSGPDPEHRSYRSFASFSDPDGNGWLLQEVTTRLPGRIDPATTTFASANDLASALRRAEAAHGEHEKRIGAAQTRTGPTGTPSTWCASSPARNCRRERPRRDRQRRFGREGQTHRLGSRAARLRQFRVVQRSGWQRLYETAEHRGSFEAVAATHDWWNWQVAYMDAREPESTPRRASGPLVATWGGGQARCRLACLTPGPRSLRWRPRARRGQEGLTGLRRDPQPALLRRSPDKLSCCRPLASTIQPKKSRREWTNGFPLVDDVGYEPTRYEPLAL